MFCRINPDAGDADFRHAIDVGGHCLLDVRATSAQVGHAREIAELHVVLVVVVHHAAVVRVSALHVVEVPRAVDGVGTVAVLAASDAHAAPGSGHMVEDRVGVNADASGLAPPHHRSELCLIARTARQHIAYRLIARVPLVPGRVLIWGRHLHRRESLGPQPPLALQRDVIPRPFEKMNEGLLGAQWRPRAGGRQGGQQRQKRQQRQQRRHRAEPGRCQAGAQTPRRRRGP
mmetsp:Transcript_46402/g.140789  ORF Transcript_46402/g.140789 Transcript_46402/m.140789 type:complete len:231 (+) Transcript_46402:789-1481(+)